MPSSVFKGGQEHNGGFRADLLTMTIAGEDAKGQIIQNVQFSYTQQITLLYEIGSNYVYYVGGRAQGTATIARVVGPSQAAIDAISKLCDLCKPTDLNVSATAGCEESASNSGQGSVDYTLQDAVLTTVAVSVTAQDVVINEQLQLMFIDLETEPGCE